MKTLFNLIAILLTTTQVQAKVCSLNVQQAQWVTINAYQARYDEYKGYFGGEKDETAALGLMTRCLREKEKVENDRRDEFYEIKCVSS